jgi:hypothetical protein
MGHLLIGTLPETLPWRRVVHLIGSGADVTAIAAATSRAAEESLIAAGRDPVPRHVFFLLTQIPLAAKSESFSNSLRKLGIYIDGPITLAALCSGFIEAVDRLAGSARDRTDFGELATLSAVETLSAIVGNEQIDLFGASDSEGELGAALRRLASASQFGVLGHDFFARLTRRHLDYYLSRELSKHVGATERFRSVREHMSFEEALDRHCREVAEIARDYSGQWFSKHVHEGGIDPAKAGGGIQYAFKKVRDELRVRRERHA